MPATDERKKPQSSFVAGAGAGFVATALLHPLDLIKTRFQVQESGGRRLPLYRGVPPRLLSVVPMVAIQFTLLEIVKRRLRARNARAAGAS